MSTEGHFLTARSQPLDEDLIQRQLSSLATMEILLDEQLQHHPSRSWASHLIVIAKSTAITLTIMVFGAWLMILTLGTPYIDHRAAENKYFAQWVVCALISVLLIGSVIFSVVYHRLNNQRLTKANAALFWRQLMRYHALDRQAHHRLQAALLTGKFNHPSHIRKWIDHERSLLHKLLEQHTTGRNRFQAAWRKLFDRLKRRPP